jgi:hypothetical protein
MDRETLNSCSSGSGCYDLGKEGSIAAPGQGKLQVSYPVVPGGGIPFRCIWRSTTTGYAIRGSRLTSQAHIELWYVNAYS